uniref:hypothetical protein n=1 Tax=Microvirga sp. Mcv34 TaxID=2926016 RepID=UPI0021CAB60C
HHPPRRLQSGVSKTAGGTVSLFLAANALAIIAVICGAFLCYKQREGWGCFLFLAFMAGAGATTLMKFPAAT